MAFTLSITPRGRLLLEEAAEELVPAPSAAAAQRIRAAFAEHAAAGLLHLAAAELETALPRSSRSRRPLRQSWPPWRCKPRP